MAAGGVDVQFASRMARLDAGTLRAGGELPVRGSPHWCSRLIPWSLRVARSAADKLLHAHPGVDIRDIHGSVTSCRNVVRPIELPVMASIGSPALQDLALRRHQQRPIAVVRRSGEVATVGDDDVAVSRDVDTPRAPYRSLRSSIRRRMCRRDRIPARVNCPGLRRRLAHHR